MNALAMEKSRKVRRKKKRKVARPNDKLVVGASVTAIEKDWTGRKGREVHMSTYRLRDLAAEGVHYSSTSATARIRIRWVTTVAAKGGELHYFDAEQVFLKADIDEEIYIELHEEYQEFPRAVGLLNKAI